MICFPNAKINIGLFVTEKRADKYHNIESIFYPLTFLKDALEIVPPLNINQSTLTLQGKTIDGEKEHNLVWKAYQLLKEQYPQQVQALSIYLLKAIPMGAGLGGGSADAAFMLKLMNDYFKLNITTEQLVKMAATLGSDCAFFIQNECAFAHGRGEHLIPNKLNLNAYDIWLICPKIHSNTAFAFSQINPRMPKFDLFKLHEVDIEDWKEVVINEFEKPIFKQYPILKQYKKMLYDYGALYASMSGSGSALYGIFKKGACPPLMANEHYDVYSNALNSTY